MSTLLDATAFVHAEAAPKPISSLQLSGHQLAETEVAAIVVMSEELLNAMGPESGALIRRELAGAVASATDAEFIRLITSGLTPLTSAGATSNQIMQEISRLLNALDVDQASKVYILAEPNTVKTIATKVNGTTGMFAFPTMGVQGGTLAGVEAIPSDGVPSGQMIAIDATACRKHQPTGNGNLAARRYPNVRCTGLATHCGHDAILFGKAILSPCCCVGILAASC